jgi:asparagine synthase (glutamine-hydrolysing)
MCGIAGIFNFNSESVGLNQLKAMTNSMVERGPDDDGFYINGPIGLGFRRLSIIDVDGGHQPLCNEDKTIYLIFNGEIYNHIELRASLTSRGHIFRTRSDAEVLIHLYEDKGIDAIADLNGMFAFALYDTQHKSLFVARDRVGIKPLFYSISQDKFTFASDVRALRAISNLELNPNAFLEYLGLAYVPGPGTMWRGVEKLQPGHYMHIDHAGQINTVRYWTLSKGGWTGSVNEAESLLDAHLSQALKFQMRSDVPIGIFLSGGVDSSALVAYAARFTNGPLQTFTINFSGKISEDARFAQLVSEKYKTQHAEIDMSPLDLEVAMDDLLSGMDEPISDSAIFPAFLLSVAAKNKGIKVLLNGAGGDEIFGGYSRHWPPRAWTPAWCAESLPPGIRAFVASAIGKFSPSRGLRASDKIFSWASGISGVNLPALEEILRSEAAYKSVVSTIQKEYRSLDHPSNFDNYMYRRMELDLNTYLPGDILSLTDKATMLASVECRVPLLDHNLIEFAYSLPPEINLLGGEPKGLFRRVLSKKLPMALLNRKKEGFNAPVSTWMQMKNGLSIEEELIGEPVSLVSELINAKSLERLISNSRNSSVVSETLFSIFLFNRWCRAQSIK